MTVEEIKQNLTELSYKTSSVNISYMMELLDKLEQPKSEVNVDLFNDIISFLKYKAVSEKNDYHIIDCMSDILTEEIPSNFGKGDISDYEIDLEYDNKVIVTSVNINEKKMLNDTDMGRVFEKVSDLFIEVVHTTDTTGMVSDFKEFLVKNK